MRIYPNTKKNYFIAVYTDSQKSYCSNLFFRRLAKISRGNPVHIVDNSDDIIYFNRLITRFGTYENFFFYYRKVPRDPMITYSQRSITDSLQFLRYLFFQSGLSFFLILESDIRAPKKLLRKFDKNREYLDKRDPDWGILGGYYRGDWHRYELKGLQKAHYVSSGCAVYKRRLLEKFPFRWYEGNLNTQPDSLISLDVQAEFNVYHDHRIKCVRLNPKDFEK